MSLLPMDYRLLEYLAESGGECSAIGIPSKIFRDEIPDDAPNLTEMGVIEHVGKNVRITALGRSLLASEISSHHQSPER
jgi:hypothetical protein